MTTPQHLYDAYIIVIDGTLFLGEALLPGAGLRVIFLSNNPTYILDNLSQLWPSSEPQPI